MALVEDIIDGLSSAPKVEAVYVGPFDTLVKSLHWGISSTFRDPCAGHSPAWIRGAGELIGRPAIELGRYALSDRLLEASLGMAAINSLIDTSGLVLREINAAEVVAARGRGRNVAVVGDFPFLQKIRGGIKNLWVVNKPPWKGAAGVKAAAEVLPRADVAAITGSSFINGTAEALLSLCPQAYTLVLGPSTPLSPVLFRYGVDAACGALVADPEQALPHVCQGASFRQIRGLRLVTLFKNENPDDDGARAG